MNMPKSLLWTQGLFLEPQHFQLLDRHQDFLLEPFRRFVAPYFWGIATLDVAKNALGSRVFAINSGEFLFPDGTHACFPGNCVVEGRSFAEAWDDGDKFFLIYLGVKKYREQGRNVTVVPELEKLSGITSRYVTEVEPDEIADQHLAGPSAQAQQLNYLLRLVWETEKDQMGDYQLLLLGQLERDGDEIRLSPHVVPPTISIRGSQELFNLIKEIRNEIASRSRRLEEFKRQRGVHNSEFGARDMVHLLALRTLNRYVPLLFQMTEAPCLHPWPVYAALRQLIGELSTFSDQISALGESADGGSLLPGYDHQSLGHCFMAAQALIVRLLDEVTAGPDYIIRLLYDGSYYCADLPAAIFEGHNHYYLAVQTGENPQAIIDGLSDIAKISTRESMPLLIVRALPGLKLSPLQTPPPALPRRAGSVYFQLDHHSETWGRIQQAKNIALYWDGAPDDFQIELMIVERA